MEVDFKFIPGRRAYGPIDRDAWDEASARASSASSWHTIPGFADVYLVSDTGVIVRNRKYGPRGHGTYLILPRVKSARLERYVYLQRPLIREGEAVGAQNEFEIVTIKARNVIRAALKDSSQEWRTFPVFMDYDVGEDGRVRSLRNLDFLNPWKCTRYGHLSVSMSFGGHQKGFTLH